MNVSITFNGESSNQVVQQMAEFVAARIVPTETATAETPDTTPVPKPETAAAKKKRLAAEKKAAAATLPAKPTHGGVTQDHVLAAMVKLNSDKEVGGRDVCVQVLAEHGGVETVGELRGPGLKAVYNACVALVGVPDEPEA